MRTIIYSNLLPFVATIFMLLFMRINPLFDKKQNKLFLLSSVIVLVMLFVISVDYAVSLGSWQYAWIIHRITSFLHFSVSSAVPIILIHIFTRKRMNLFLYLPALLNAVFCAVSLFVKLVFFHKTDGGYDRGPLFFVPSIVAAFYIIYLLVTSLMERRERPYEALYLIGVILGIVLAMYLEIVEYFKFLIWDFVAVFLILYYLLLNVNRSKLDPLTGANNRAMYVQKTEMMNHDRSGIIAMIDINGFKKINDEKGHGEGDRLLKRFVSTARAFTDKKNIFYRIGGDEFAIISEETSMNAFRERIESFFAKLKEYDIYCAVGYEIYDPELDIESVIRTADLKMYEDKRRYYADKASVPVGIAVRAESEEKTAPTES